MKDWKTSVASSSKHYLKNDSQPTTYGTAGFRMKAEKLDHVIYRMGLLAAIRSKVKNGKIIGVMITASHNPEPDNGVKLVDPMGEMLQQAWESVATSLANCHDDKLISEIESICAKFGISIGHESTVMIGCDTRPSSPHLAVAAIKGAESLNTRVVDLGVVTTPVLHYAVAKCNSGQMSGPSSDYVTKYTDTLTSAFKSLRQDGTSNLNYSSKLYFDGANGVGALAMEMFVQKLGDSISIEMFNSDTKTKGKLNHQCGADFVKTNQRFPEGVPQEAGVRCASVDGDADRLIYYYLDESFNFHLLDGDRIATLVAGYLQELLTESGLDLKLGLVQTAYANGSSTKYITDQLRVEVSCVETGVKYLHHKACEYDLGVYFEANGHGTVVVSSQARQQIEGSTSEGGRRLARLVHVINDCVGDAISDLLLVESVLLARGWGPQDWLASYTDLPNRLTKVLVKDRAVFETKNAEREVVKPVGLQEEINIIVSKYNMGRSFVRPSGTEDLVRVYAEAATREEVDKLSVEVGAAVYRLAGGIGDPPVLPPASL